MNSVLASMSRIAPKLNAKVPNFAECVLQKSGRGTTENSVEMPTSRAISRHLTNVPLQSNHQPQEGINKRTELSYVTKPPQKWENMNKPMGKESAKERECVKQVIAKKLERSKHGGNPSAADKLKGQSLMTGGLPDSASIQRSAFVKAKHMQNAFVGKRIAENLANSSRTLFTLGQQGNKSNLRTAAPAVFRTLLARDFRHRKTVSNNAFHKNPIFKASKKTSKQSGMQQNKGPVEMLNKREKTKSSARQAWKQWVAQPNKLFTKLTPPIPAENLASKTASEPTKKFLKIRDVYAKDGKTQAADHELKDKKEMLGSDKKKKKPTKEKLPCSVFLASPKHKCEPPNKATPDANANKSGKIELQRISDEISDLTNLIENITKS